MTITLNKEETLEYLQNSIVTKELKAELSTLRAALAKATPAVPHKGFPVKSMQPKVVTHEKVKRFSWKPHEALLHAVAIDNSPSRRNVDTLLNALPPEVSVTRTQAIAKLRAMGYIVVNKTGRILV